MIDKGSKIALPVILLTWPVIEFLIETFCYQSRKQKFTVTHIGTVMVAAAVAGSIDSRTSEIIRIQPGRRRPWHWTRNSAPAAAIAHSYPSPSLPLCTGRYRDAEPCDSGL